MSLRARKRIIVWSSLGFPDAKGVGWVFRTRDANDYYAARISLLQPGASVVLAEEHFSVFGGEESAHSRKVMSARQPRRFGASTDGCHRPVFTLSLQGSPVDYWTDARLDSGAARLLRRAWTAAGVQVAPLHFYQERGGTAPRWRRFHEPIRTIPHCRATRPSRSDASSAGVARARPSAGGARCALRSSREFSLDFHVLRGDLNSSWAHAGSGRKVTPSVIAEEPDHIYAQGQLGLCQQRLQNWDAAAQAFEAVLQFDPHRDEVRLHLADCLLRLRRFGAALECFDECWSEASRRRALFGKAVALQFLRRLDEAEKHYERLLAIDPHAEEAHREYDRHGNGSIRAGPRAEIFAASAGTQLALRGALKGLALAAIERRDYAGGRRATYHRVAELDPEIMHPAREARDAVEYRISRKDFRQSGRNQTETKIQNSPARQTARTRGKLHMARLRIRIELNRGGVGVPLHKLASVVEEAQKFFYLLTEDVHIDQSQGEWLGFDFGNESLNFTAEFVGPVTAEQVAAFHAAFDGTTSLRRATISQFARITDSIEQDELIGFGLYLRMRAMSPPSGAASRAATLCASPKRFKC